jgi:hypothetical protein
LKQSHSTRTKRKAIANIQQSCSDSPGFANPMDGVFGTDSHIGCPYSKLRKPKKSWSFSGIQGFE